MFGTAIGTRPLAETIELGNASREKMGKVSRPKLVKTFSLFHDDKKELIHESNSQLIMILPDDIFESSQDLKRFFDENVATTICNTQKQILALKIIGQVGGITRNSCKGTIASTRATYRNKNTLGTYCDISKCPSCEGDDINSKIMKFKSKKTYQLEDFICIADNQDLADLQEVCTDAIR